ncbi:hypothetical protein [Paraburkholderia youngii]|uniref:hypothetical protein n=1 Tax=Paraburkholderia youngii TaxID=2782701 RepID=UPI003D21D86D
MDRRFPSPAPGLGVSVYGLSDAVGIISPLVLDPKGVLPNLGRTLNLPHYESAFRNANILALHKGDSYNPPIVAAVLQPPLSPPPPPLVD